MKCCFVLPLCSVLFSHVESCSVDLEGSQKCLVDKINFLLFEDVEARCSVVLPFRLNIVQFAHAYFKGNGPKSCVHPITEEMFTGQCSGVLPYPKIFLCPHTEQGEKCSTNVQCKRPVVLRGL